MPINEISGLDDNSVQFPEKQPNNFQSDNTFYIFTSNIWVIVFSLILTSMWYCHYFLF